jgi:hypothetical protein
MYLSSPSTLGSLPTGQFSAFECPSILNKDGSLKLEKQLHNELGFWIKQSILEGNEFLKSCRAYPSIEKAIDIICREFNNKTGSTLSQVWANNTKRDIKEMCCILSNIRPSWLYKANNSRDPKWLEQARIQNGLSDDWYNESDIDMTLKKLLELGTVEGTGYISPIWNPDLRNSDGTKGGIELKLYRYNEVLPIQLGRDFDLQRAYGVILIDEMPINRARRIFYNKQHQLQPDRGETRLARDSILSSTRDTIKGFWDAITTGDRDRRKTYPSPVVDVLYIYVDDYSVNPTNHEIEMGEGSWAYTIPFIGQQIFDGYNTDGSIRMRRANINDCKLYPNRRLIIATKTCILYDGPSYWWHRQVPIVKYSPDEWVFSYLGFSMAAEVMSLDTAANEMRRDIQDALKLKLDPPMAFEEMGLAKSTVESSTIRKPGKRFRLKLSMGESAKPLLPSESYDVGNGHFEFVNETENKVKEILGLPDLQALQQARQIPASDTVSQFFSQAGAIVTSMSRGLDPVLKFIADCNRYYFYQFYDITRRIRILGQDGTTKEDFDYDPSTLIPQSLPNEPMDDRGIYKSTLFERAKHHLTNFRTTIEATSLHQITHMQRKLLLLQATKLIPGYPMIDPETLARELDIPNWGHLDGDTIQEKVLEFMKSQVQFQLMSQAEQMKLQLMVQAMAQQASPQGQIAGALGQVGEALQNESQLGIHAPVGHPPNFSAPPKLVNNNGNTTITTS